MPCDRIYTTTVNLEVADRDLLVKAIRSLGLQAAMDANGRITFWTANGTGGIYRDRLTVPEADTDLVNRIKSAYSREVVALASQRFGWVSKQVGENTLTLTRRY
jgi:hypothetical protein